jgi:hypothetical protein
MLPFATRTSIAALCCAAFLAGPPAVAQTTAAQTTAPHTGAARAASSEPETVDQRIANLHKSLKITADEETAWTAVAQAMRDNAAAMQKLIEERDADAAKPVTAVDDLNSYQQFAQQHADGLKNLITAFDTLYNAMPDPQKKLADQVFASSRHQGAQAHG